MTPPPQLLPPGPTAPAPPAPRSPDPPPHNPAQIARTLLLCTLLAAAAGGARAQQCAAEADCVSQACTQAYQNNATAFPYTLDYTIAGDSNSTTFVFNVSRALLQRPRCAVLS